MLVHVASKVDLFALTNMHIFSRASVRLVLAGARSARCKSTLLAALVERSPMLTPDEAPLTVVQQQAQAAAVRQKVYPTTLTAAEEGPDQQRARLRMEALVEREGGREGDGDRTGDQRSLDRQLAHRLYLLVQVDGRWQFPHLAWQPPESARDGLRRAITQSCGDGLATHQMGNAPLGHTSLASGDALFLWRHLYVSGEVTVPPGNDYAWVTKAELAKLVSKELGDLSAIACGPFS